MKSLSIIITLFLYERSREKRLIGVRNFSFLLVKADRAQGGIGNGKRIKTRFRIWIVMDIDYEIGHRHGRGIHRCDRNASDENPNRGPGRGHNRDREHDLDRVLDQRQDQDRG